MEAFSLLKYWRGGGGGDNFTNSNSNATIITTATTTATIDDEDEDENENENDNDDGPFFDLEFSVDDDDDEAPKSDNDDDEEEDEVGEREFKFTLSSPSGSSNGPTDGEPNLSLALSPSDDLFFKGKLVPIETLSPGNSDQANTKPQFPVSSLLKSATKFRVFMLGLKKSKSGNNAEKIRTEPSAESALAKPQGKFFTVKFKVDEVPIVSLFTRDNSSRIVSSAKPAAKQSSDRETTTTETTTNSSSSSSEEKRFAREVVQKYLKMVKPLYVKVSRRYGESKPRLAAGHISVKPASPPAPETESPPSAAEAPAAESLAEVVEAPAASVTAAKGGLNLPAGLRVVCKHLGKSRSASSAAIAAAPAMAAAAGTASSKRRDDSLIQQQDGIQSAILHCKRSFNAARDSEAALLARCVSDPSKEKKPLDISRKSSDGTIHRS